MSVEVVIGTGRVRLGEHSYVGGPIKCFVDLEVGKYTSIASELRIISGQHPPVNHPQAVANYPFFEREGLGDDYWPSKMGGYVNVGHDVWIGEDVAIMEGCVIENGAIIAARSTVVHDVAPYSVVAGCPAEHRKMRFTADRVAALLDIAWWNWSHLDVLAGLPLLRDVDRFIARYH